MKKTILTITLCLMAFAASSQTPNYVDALTGKNNSWIAECIKPGVSIVHSNYVLEDRYTQERFGLENRPYYGEGYALAFRFPNGYIVYDNAVNPWRYDPNYIDFYTPEDTLLPTLTNTTFTYTNIDDTLKSNLIFQRIDPTNAKAVSMIPQSNSDNTTLPICYSFGDLNGFIVWAHIPEKEELSFGSKVELSVSNQKLITVSSDSAKVSVKAPNTSYKYLGGLFVTPQVLSAGRVEFTVRGVLVCEKGKWYVSMLTPAKVQQPVDEPGSSVTPDDTPVNKPPVTPADDDNKKVKKKGKK